MKTIIVIPKKGIKKTLLNCLNARERELRDTNTTFSKDDKGKWKHNKYSGSIEISISKSGILNAELKCRDAGYEWQLLQAFIGYLDRHLSDQIENTTIVNR